MKSGDSNQSVTVGAASRTYILHIPTGYTGTKPLPLVVDFHALGGNGSGQKGLSHWDTKGDSNMFITAFPDSASNGGNGWNVGMCCQSAQSNQVDDVGFTRAMIKQIEGMACVDPKRIYASGCSNGGGMTYKVACDMADVFAAGAPVDFRCVYGGTTASPSCAGCNPARPISIIHFDNTGDTSLVPYNGGMTSFAADCPPNQSCTGMGFPSAAANFPTGQTLDQCTGSTAPTPGSCATNSSCQGGTEVMICVRSGGSHCGNYDALKIVDTAWTEFQKLSLP
jgi:polyhydroxybutyrate depolymerase